MQSKEKNQTADLILLPYFGIFSGSIHEQGKLDTRENFQRKSRLRFSHLAFMKFEKDKNKERAMNNEFI